LHQMKCLNPMRTTLVVTNALIDRLREHDAY
jgi:hypothetical protein